MLFTINYNMKRIAIVRGVHRYEKTAHMLGPPLIEELRKNGVYARLNDVPEQVADTSREETAGYRKNKKVRERWWKNLHKSNVIFSLHSYPVDQPESVTRYKGCREIGRIDSAGIYIFDRTGLVRPGIIRQLVDLHRKGISIYEDSAVIFASVIEVPAVGKGLEVDIRQTLERGFVGEKVVKIIEKEIEKLTKNLKVS